MAHEKLKHLCFCYIVLFNSYIIATVHSNSATWNVASLSKSEYISDICLGKAEQETEDQVGGEKSHSLVVLVEFHMNSWNWLFQKTKDVTNSDGLPGLRKFHFYPSY